MVYSSLKLLFSAPALSTYTYHSDRDLSCCCWVVQYGKQTVPMSAEQESHLKYLPEKDMQVIGFVTLDQVPRHTYMKVSRHASLCSKQGIELDS